MHRGKTMLVIAHNRIRQQKIKTRSFYFIEKLPEFTRRYTITINTTNHKASFVYFSSGEKNAKVKTTYILPPSPFFSSVYQCIYQRRRLTKPFHLNSHSKFEPTGNSLRLRLSSEERKKLSIVLLYIPFQSPDTCKQKMFSFVLNIPTSLVLHRLPLDRLQGFVLSIFSRT